MSDAASLTPQNATPLMRAVSMANAERRPIAPGQLATLWDPMTAPSEVLPYLAAAHGVSVWRTDWTDDRKRRVIARSIDLKRRRGTLPCFEGHLEFVDAELVQAIAAPSLSVVRASMTPAQREAWAAQFPELRVFHYRTRGRLRGVLTPGRWRSPILTVRKSAAGQLAGVRALIVDRGEEREAPVQVAAGEDAFALTLQVGLRSTGRRFVLGTAGGGFMVPRSSDAGSNLYTFKAAGSGPDTLRPGLAVLDVAPRRVSSPMVGVCAVTAGQAFAGPFRFLRRSRAREGVYDAVRIYERTRVQSGRVRRRAGLTPGHSRLGQPAFHLELAVDCSFKRRKARRFPHLPGFVEAFDRSRLDEVLAAVRAAKLGRDKIEVGTALHRRIAVGDGIPLDGSFRLGQIIRSL